VFKSDIPGSASPTSPFSGAGITRKDRPIAAYFGPRNYFWQLPPFPPVKRFYIPGKSRGNPVHPLPTLSNFRIFVPSFVTACDDPLRPVGRVNFQNRQCFQALGRWDGCTGGRAQHPWG